jgi:S-adenosylmethionine-diacylglycerol 3-amino-3-carboxypropyl transferase
MPAPSGPASVQTWLFDAVHSRHLVYATCWEDPVVDRLALDIGPDDEVLTITSGGCNALDLLLAGAHAVHAVDINPRQTALLEFRAAAIRGLDDESVFALFGRGRTRHARSMYHDAIRGRLTSDARRFWDTHISYFSGHGWRNSFLYCGTAGAAHKMLRDYAYVVRGLGSTLEELLAAPDVERQRVLYREHHVRERFASPAMRWLLASNALLTLLGIPASQRNEIEQHPGGTVGYALDIIETAFTRTHLAKNYFWRGVLEGRYTPGCCPEYLQPVHLARLRSGLLDRLHVWTASVTGFLASGAGATPISRFVLLDHMDWLANGNRGALAAEWTAILSRARAPARAIFRSAGREVGYLDALPVTVCGRSRRLGTLLRYDRERAAALHASDRTCIYGSFHIAHLSANAS